MHLDGLSISLLHKPHLRSAGTGAGRPTLRTWVYTTTCTKLLVAECRSLQVADVSDREGYRMSHGPPDFTGKHPLPELYIYVGYMR